jgi:hypothetical protein
MSRFLVHPATVVATGARQPVRHSRPASHMQGVVENLATFVHNTSARLYVANICMSDYFLLTIFSQWSRRFVSQEIITSSFSCTPQIFDWERFRDDLIRVG